MGRVMHFPSYCYDIITVIISHIDSFKYFILVLCIFWCFAGLVWQLYHIMPRCNLTMGIFSGRRVLKMKLWSATRRQSGNALIITYNYNVLQRKYHTQIHYTITIILQTQNPSLIIFNIYARLLLNPCLVIFVINCMSISFLLNCRN